MLRIWLHETESSPACGNAAGGRERPGSRGLGPYLTVVMALKVEDAMLTMAWFVWLACCSAFFVCRRYRAAVAAVDRITVAIMGPKRQDSASSTRTCVHKWSA